MSSSVRRSTLFTPADRPDRMKKAAETVADALVFDLEDAVPPARVPKARENVRRILDGTDFGHKEVGTRINGLGTERWREDLRIVVAAGVDAVLVPKVEAATAIETFVSVLDSMTDDPPTVRFAIESPTGLFAGREIADRCQSIQYVTGLTFGLADYCSVVGAPAVNERIREHLTVCVGTIAAAAGLDAFASTHLDVDDEPGLRAAAELARSFGYGGMSAIHPRQLASINEIFTPDSERVERARRLVAAYEQSDVDSLLVEGEFLDDATVERHRALVERYEAVQRVESGHRE